MGVFILRLGSSTLTLTVQIRVRQIHEAHSDLWLYADLTLRGTPPRNIAESARRNSRYSVRSRALNSSISMSSEGLALSGVRSFTVILSSDQFPYCMSIEHQVHSKHSEAPSDTGPLTETVAAEHGKHDIIGNSIGCHLSS